MKVNDEMNEQNENLNELLLTPENSRKILEEKESEEQIQTIETTENTDNITERFSSIEDDIFRNIGSNSSVVKRKNSRFVEILLVVLACITTLSITAASLYCIVSDISESSVQQFVNGRPDNFILNVSGKPHNVENFVDENGRYTVEGLADVVRPQIVEIYTYTDKNSDVITGSGSGIVISDNGYIVTNTHVLDGMEKHIVKTYDGKTYEAQITGRDAKTDIAVIKIEAVGLIPAQFGNSDEVIQGESVVVVGNPAGLTGSITDGIVSGLNRKIKTDTTGFEMNCIQTNAAISPGNSGGALVNMYGQVIGIISSKYANTTTEGLGFAITINEAKPIIEELISQGYVSGRVRIGITFYTAYADYMNVMFKEEFGFDIPKELENTLWIDDISKDCDISNTELKKNDFIVSVDGVEVSDYDTLEQAIRGKKGGDTVKAKCARVSDDGKVSYFDIEFKLMTDTSGDY